MKNFLKKLFHRHKYVFIEEKIIPRSFTNVIGIVDGKLTSNIKDVQFRKEKFYVCKDCGRVITGSLVEVLKIKIYEEK